MVGMYLRRGGRYDDRLVNNGNLEHEHLGVDTLQRCLVVPRGTRLCDVSPSTARRGDFPCFYLSNLHDLTIYCSALD